MIPLMTPTEGSSDGCFPALLIGVGPTSCTKPTLAPVVKKKQKYLIYSFLKRPVILFFKRNGICTLSISQITTVIESVMKNMSACLDQVNALVNNISVKQMDSFPESFAKEEPFLDYLSSRRN